MSDLFSCDFSSDPPVDSAGHAYKISVAGIVGGSSGKPVDVGDLIICNHDSTPSGDEATIGAYWDAFQGNLEVEYIGQWE